MPSTSLLRVLAIGLFLISGCLPVGDDAGSNGDGSGDVFGSNSGGDGGGGGDGGNEGGGNEGGGTGGNTAGGTAGNESGTDGNVANEDGEEPSGDEGTVDSQVPTSQVQISLSIGDQTSYDFGSVAIGQTHNFEITLTNIGTVGFTIPSGFVIPPPFGVGNDCAGPLNPLESCSIEIEFSPTVVGPVTRDIVLGFGGNNPRVFQLRGTGAAAVPNITVELFPSVRNVADAVTNVDGVRHVKLQDNQTLDLSWDIQGRPTSCDLGRLYVNPLLVGGIVLPRLSPGLVELTCRAGNTVVKDSFIVDSTNTALSLQGGAYHVIAAMANVESEKKTVSFYNHGAVPIGEMSFLAGYPISRVENNTCVSLLPGQSCSLDYWVRVGLEQNNTFYPQMLYKGYEGGVLRTRFFATTIVLQKPPPPVDNTPLTIKVSVTQNGRSFDLTPYAVEGCSGLVKTGGNQFEIRTTVTGYNNFFSCTFTVKGTGVNLFGNFYKNDINPTTKSLVVPLSNNGTVSGQ